MATEREAIKMVMTLVRNSKRRIALEFIDDDSDEAITKKRRVEKTQQTKHVCEMCGEFFAKKDTLKCHLSNVHSQ